MNAGDRVTSAAFRFQLRQHSLLEPGQGVVGRDSALQLRFWLEKVLRLSLCEQASCYA